MAVPVIPILFGAALLLLGSSKKSSSGSSSSTGSSSDMLMRNPLNGVVQVRPDKLVGILGWLNAYFATPVPPNAEVATYGGSQASLSTTPGAESAVATIGRYAALGQHTLINIDGGPPKLWFVPRGAELAVAKLMPGEGGKWALLVEGSSAAVPMTPGVPGQGMSPGGVAPGVSQTPGGPTIPGSYNPGGAAGGQTVNIPGIGPVTIPAIPGMPEVPPIQGQAPPAVVVPPGVPGMTDVPGIATPATYTLQKGDIASRMAERFTGDFSRWKELGLTNAELVIVNEDRKPVAQYGGAAFGFLPWKPGQPVILPPGWDITRPLKQAGGVAPAKAKKKINAKDAIAMVKAAAR